MLALIPGERILYHSKPHWVYLAGASTFLLIGLSCSCCTGITALAEPSPGQPSPPAGMIYSFVTCSSIPKTRSRTGTFLSGPGREKFT